jgi:hypothetical protein
MSILELIKASGRWTVIGLGFLTAAEVAARVEDRLTWGAPLAERFSEERLTVRDSLGNHGRPHYQFKKWRMNNLGFRGADIAPVPAEGVTRVALLGASETFGLYESPEHEYAVRLQQVMDSIAPHRWEIVNTGLPGLSLSSMIPYYRGLVAPIEPAYVLVYPSPSFYLEVNPLPPVYVIPRAGNPAEDGGLVLRFPSRARESLKALVPAKLLSAYRAWSLQRRRAGQPSDWVWHQVPPDRMELMRGHVRMLVDSIQASGAKPVLVTHTNRFMGAAADTLSADRRRLTDLASLYYPKASMTVMVAVDSAANQVLREVALEKGAGVIEVEKRIPPTSAYFADYAHFTDAGAAAMAHLLAEGLQRLGPR